MTEETDTMPAVSCAHVDKSPIWRDEGSMRVLVAWTCDACGVRGGEEQPPTPPDPAPPVKPAGEDV